MFAATRLVSAKVGKGELGIRGLLEAKIATARSMSPPPSPPATPDLCTCASGCPLYDGLLMMLLLLSNVTPAARKNGSYVELSGFRSNRHRSSPAVRPRIEPA